MKRIVSILLAALMILAMMSIFTMSFAAAGKDEKALATGSALSDCNLWIIIVVVAVVIVAAAVLVILKKKSSKNSDK